MSNTKYYCVGFSWGNNSESQLSRFIKDGIWEDDNDGKNVGRINNVAISSRLAAKTAYTRKVNGKTVSVLEVHCIGTVVNNPKDGRSLKVEWEKDFVKYKLDGKGAYRSTISEVHKPDNLKEIFNLDQNIAKPTPPSDNNMPEQIELNQILYGPPGTGKTYHTINKSLEILGLEVENRSRTAIKEDFDNFIKDGRIVFCTFHQSLSYEDFIEGLKPLKPSSETNEVTYDVVPGLFKRICDDANRALQGVEVSLQNKTYSDFLQELSLEIETKGKVILKSKSKTDVVLHNITDDEVIYASPEVGELPYRNYSVLKDKLLILDAYFESIDNINNVVDDIRNAVKGVAHTYYWAVLKAFKDFKSRKNLKNILNEKKNKNYVLIIDEINRGNVSQIFGELITLIEKDKRDGQAESLEVVLPYSKEPFSVPPNLYIVGTMNTADRSVEALDTALRRRFSFVEMSSKPELLSPQQMVWQLWWRYANLDWKDEPFFTEEQQLYNLLGSDELINTRDEQKDVLWHEMFHQSTDCSIFDPFEFTGWNLQVLLTKINTRLEKLLSPDHAIGHSYFMSICSLEGLLDVIYNKIIPLLQEYFYGDFGRIGLVLGKGFIRAKQHADDDFAQWDYDPDAIPDKDVYEILDHRLKQPFEVDINNKTEKVDFPKALNLLLNNKVEKPE